MRKTEAAETKPPVLKTELADEFKPTGDRLDRNRPVWNDREDDGEPHMLDQRGCASAESMQTAIHYSKWRSALETVLIRVLESAWEIRFECAR